MAEKTGGKRRILKWCGIVLLVLLLFPVLHVGITAFWNPKWSPMQWERGIEAKSVGKKWRNFPVIWTPLADIPPQLIHYIWASEDQAFFQHSGFDLRQMRRAIADAKEKGQTVRGASTITMQCARSVYLWQDRSYIRKAIEAYYTLWMELLLSKPRILELYLNHIEFGPGIYGVGAAAKYHFNKTPAELNQREMLALAAILPNPLNWSPTHPSPIVQSKIRRVQRLASRAPFPLDKLQK